MSRGHSRRGARLGESPVACGPGGATWAGDGTGRRRRETGADAHGLRFGSTPPVTQPPAPLPPLRSLSPLVRKVHDAQVDEVMVALCNSVLTGKEEQRDICAIGLKTVVLEMPVFMGATAVRQLVPRLVQGVRDDALEVGARKHAPQSTVCPRPHSCPSRQPPLSLCGSGEVGVH